MTKDVDLAKFLTRERHAVHLIGVAGSGMSGIAGLLLQLGHEVSGSDKLDSQETDRLQRLGLKFYHQHRAADDHQTRNAEIFARGGAAFVLKESELSPELLTRKIREMIDHPEQLRRMSESSARLAPRDAANRVAATMEKYTQS